MPIEVQIEKTHGKHLPVGETQRLCRAYATEQIARQKARLPAPRRAGRLGPSVHDDGLQERGRRDPHARQAAREGLRLSRPEAGQLVLRLRQRAGRSRGRVRGPRGHRDRRRLSARSTPSATSSRRRSACAALPDGPVLRGDLDDDAVDDSRQPGAERPSRARLRAGRTRARGHARPRAGPGRGVPRALQARRARSSRRAKGAALERIRFRHPFYDRASPVYLGDTSRSSRAPASSIRRRPTASRTSSRAAATA